MVVTAVLPSEIHRRDTHTIRSPCPWLGAGVYIVSYRDEIEDFFFKVPEQAVTI